MAAGTPVAFEIECYDFPCAALSPYAHLRLGIQEREDIVQDAPCSDGAACFRFVLEATWDEADGSMIWRGGYAHGPRADRFIYLCWGAWGEHGWQHFRRAKVPLKNINRTLILQALQEGRPLRARIRMTDDRGEPAAATLKPDQATWTL